MALTDTAEYSQFVRRILAAYERRVVATGDAESLSELAALAAAVNRTTVAVVGRLMDDHGYSFADIGRGLGVSRQAARQRFGDHC